ncbi:MAG: aldo/keto reductase, partial [Planctomycetia bacterium]|nr:aldo/keto reductase [Planctomycetia bacterium]
FVQRSGLVAGGMLVGANAVGANEPQEPSNDSPGEIPRRTLGKTGVSLTAMTLGSAPMGKAPSIMPPETAETIRYALDLGINAIDTAPTYRDAEEGVGLGLLGRRKQVFLSTKVLADTIADAESSLANSFKMLKTDYIDLLYFHSLGSHDVDQALADDGVFTWLVKQKQAGKCRFIGVTGHNYPGKFAPYIETGQVDALLTVINLVDQHTYGFEEKVLPLAREHNVGIVAMKVFGGARDGLAGYQKPGSPPQLDVQHMETAVRYSLGTPGVTTLNLGVHSPRQVRQNLELVKNFKPLRPDELAAADALGKELAADWGEHFGPVA